MRTEELISIVKDRGLEIVLVAGEPRLVRPKGNHNATDKLMAMLKRHRSRIIAMLSPKTPDKGDAYEGKEIPE